MEIVWADPKKGQKVDFEGKSFEADPKKGQKNDFKGKTLKIGTKKGKGLFWIKERSKIVNFGRFSEIGSETVLRGPKKTRKPL